MRKSYSPERYIEIDREEIFCFFRKEVGRLYNLIHGREENKYPLIGNRSRRICSSIGIEVPLYKDNILTTIFKDEIEERKRLEIMLCYIDDELAECENTLEGEELENIKERIAILKKIKDKIEDLLKGTAR